MKNANEPARPARPEPRITPDAAAYWEAVRDHGVRSAQRCPRCERTQFYPRLLCVRCGGPVEQRSLSGRGTVYSFTVVHRAPAGFAGLVPYAVVLVDLDEGVRVLGRLHTGDPRHVRIGQRVATVIEDDAGGEVPLPQFTPTSGE